MPRAHGAQERPPLPQGKGRDIKLLPKLTFFPARIGADTTREWRSNQFLGPSRGRTREPSPQGRVYGVSQKLIGMPLADGEGLAPDTELHFPSCTALTRLLAPVIWPSIHRVVFNGLAASRSNRYAHATASCANELDESVT